MFQVPKKYRVVAVIISLAIIVGSSLYLWQLRPQESHRTAHMEAIGERAAKELAQQLPEGASIILVAHAFPGRDLLEPSVAAFIRAAVEQGLVLRSLEFPFGVSRKYDIVFESDVIWHETYKQIAMRNQDVDAIVSLVGIPVADSEEALQSLGDGLPPLMVVAVRKHGLRPLFEAGVVTWALALSPDPASVEVASADPVEWVNLRYNFYSAAQFDDLP